MKERLKSAARKVLVGPGVREVFRPWTSSRVPILMAHRFTRDGGGGSTSADLLDACLSFLARAGFKAVTLADLCARVRSGPIPSRQVCFTVDDGYRDFADVALPVLVRHGVPATVFVASDFIDGKAWYWWDRIEYAFEKTSRAAVSVPLGAGEGISLAWRTPAERDAACAAFTSRVKLVPEEVKLEAIRFLEEKLEVHLPDTPPYERRGMTWEELRQLASSGIEFGGHTVSHPILSRVSPQVAEQEVVRGIQRIEAQTGIRPRTFAYPNGGSADFTQEVVKVLEREGILGAVTGEPGIVSRSVLGRLPDAMFRLPRMGMPGTLEEFEQIVVGVEGLIQAVRS